jgi:type I site-specific restriction-modification system R (restriction) subunit|tara:strand:+ start:45 stop:338 length:294 start_codon:yes stop_codon:yes gene_type:complete
MEMKDYSDYAKYLVLSDNSRTVLRTDYVYYQNFKVIKEIINSMAHSDKNTYLYEGNIYTRKITSTDAKNILTNIDLCKWNSTTNKMFLVASQVGLRI